MTEWWSDLTDTVPRWLETLRSPNGLYRMSASAYHEESLDATTLAMDLTKMLDLPPWEVRNSGDSGQSLRCQDRTSGLFQEPFCEFQRWGENRLWEMSATYFGWQMAALWLGLGWDTKGLHPFKFYSQFLEPGAISRYMTDNMPWDTKPMGAGNMVDAAATMMRMNVAMGHYEYWHVITEMYQWLWENRTDDGFWGKPKPDWRDQRVQAGYHVLRGLHLQDGRRLEYPERMILLVIDCIDRPTAPLDACHYMDCAVLLDHLSRGYISTDWLRSTAQKLIDDIVVMYRRDGAFSFSVEGAIKNHNRYEVTPGKMESDLVGTVFYLQALRSALHVLGEEVPWGESATHGVMR
jgi:hypothetical protein